MGTLGYHGVALVQCEMGAIGVNSSMMTSLAAINLWEPNAVIMVGIAFGVSSQKQNIGDVLVSSHIIPYEFVRQGAEIIYRSENPPSSTFYGKPGEADKRLEAFSWGGCGCQRLL